MKLNLKPQSFLEEVFGENGAEGGYRNGRMVSLDWAGSGRHGRRYYVHDKSVMQLIKWGTILVGFCAILTGLMVMIELLKI